MNSSAIHFTYNNNRQNDTLANFTTQLNMSMVVDKEKENLTNQNLELKKSNQALVAEKKRLIEELKSSALQMSPEGRLSNKAK